MQYLVRSHPFFQCLHLFDPVHVERASHLNALHIDLGAFWSTFYYVCVCFVAFNFFLESFTFLLFYLLNIRFSFIVIFIIYRYRFVDVDKLLLCWCSCCYYCSPLLRYRFNALKKSLDICFVVFVLVFLSFFGVMVFFGLFQFVCIHFDGGLVYVCLCVWVCLCVCLSVCACMSLCLCTSFKIVSSIRFELYNNWI